jgi:hypothetical protein
LPGGPLSEQGGLFWIALPQTHVAAEVLRLPRLGYTVAVDSVQPHHQGMYATAAGALDGNQLIRWQRRPHRLVRLYEEDPDLARALALDRRTFLYETSRGEVRAVTGYRGSSKPLSRRGLPVYDAKMLVNIAFDPGLGVLLDPFAGAGGIVAAAIASGWQAVSGDVDPALRHGLLAMGAEHHVCDARALPLASESVDAVATEPPYADEAAGMLSAALDEMHRVLKPGGMLAMLCAAWQAEALRDRASALGLRSYLDAAVNRKGLDVVVLAWEK